MEKPRRAPIIARVLAENVGQPEKEIRKALRAAYPFGQYAMHPLKVWLDEIRVQMGKKKSKVRRKGDPLPRPKDCAGQVEMFTEGGP